MALPLWTILLATIGLIWFLKRRQARKEKLGNLKELPGPKGLPLVGNLLQIRRNQTEQFCKWTKEFGDIYKVKLGNLKLVIVSDPKLAKEVFSSDPVFTGKFVNKDLSLFPDNPNAGILQGEGENWEVHRRFLLRQLRDFGFGKSSMEVLIMDEVQEVIDRYRKKAGTPVGEIRETIKLAVVNSLWRIISSERFAQDDKRLLKLTKDTTDNFLEVVSNGALLFFIPWIRHIIPDASGYTAIQKLIVEIHDFLNNALQKKKQSHKEGDQNDFMDVFLAEMKKDENNPKSHFYGHKAEQQLIGTLSDLFFAGSDTTATTLGWSILYLCKFPETQKKLQKEVQEVVGDSRNVSVDDRPNMPYTLALIDEILRMSSIVPDGVQHRAMADSEFRGYFIEKDTLIQPNLHYIHYNPKIWGDPENFRPERFLTPDGKKYLKNENMQAFQIGRRQCVGETLARDSLFLYITNLFKQFDMKFNPAEKEPSIDHVAGFIRMSNPYSVIMTERVGK